MFEWLKQRVLRLMKVPHEPEPPLGAPGSVRVFRAGDNFYRLKLLRWAVAQGGAVIGIGFSLVFFRALEEGVERARLAAAAGVEANPSPSVSPDSALATATPSPATGPSLSPSEERRLARAERNLARRRQIRGIVARTPGYVVPLVWMFEAIGIALFVVQAFITYAIVRLEFEQHWYMVTDRSLRIRTGILRLSEATTSFANIQQVEIRQGPLQRFLGLADVCVRSAGGSDPAAGAKGHGGDPSLHTGTFQGVSNAVEIRDLIIERLRRFREAGLGDPDDRRHQTMAGEGLHSEAEAAAILLAEVKALRRELVREA